MIISKSQMDDMHSVQLEIFKNVVYVLDKLNLTYFFVHGSLLGAVTINKFMPLDDDIDIAMPRKDYDLFIEKGNDYLSDKYFIQSNRTDKNYPLDFAKVRDCDTAYVAELFKKINMNHGIFIDVFPIDFCSDNTLREKLNDFKLKLISIRSSVAYDFKHISAKQKLLRMISKVVYPSEIKARQKREKICGSVKSGKKVKLTGGKPAEFGIPANWFDETQKADFEGLSVLVPKMYDEYLTRIYGDYKKRTLLENKQHDDDSVEINACIFDTETSYKTKGV